MDAAHPVDSARNDVVGTPVSAPVFVIGEEEPGDVAAREALLDRAMGPNRKRKSSEKLRRGRLPARGLALVARASDDTLVGTVRLWNVTLGEGGCDALLLGPLAVEPERKGEGIGSALMLEAIARARVLGHAAIVLVGDPEYYARFGFSAEKTGNLVMPGPFEKRRLLALELVPAALDGASGIISASEAIDAGSSRSRIRAAA